VLTQKLCSTPIMQARTLRRACLSDTVTLDMCACSPVSSFSFISICQWKTRITFGACSGLIRNTMQLLPTVSSCDGQHGRQATVPTSALRRLGTPHLVHYTLCIMEACSLDAHIGAMVVGHGFERLSHIGIPPINDLCAWRQLLFDQAVLHILESPIRLEARLQ
jgi:hypothetical protein